MARALELDARSNPRDSRRVAARELLAARDEVSPNFGLWEK